MNRVTSEDILNIAKAMECANKIKFTDGNRPNLSKMNKLMFYLIDKYKNQLDEEGE